MPSLKELKNRIKSVKSTQKITKAMKMVAASKLRRAQERAEAARPFSTKIENVIQNLAKSANPATAPELLTGKRDAQGNIVNSTHLFIVTAADRGLCGGFNGSIIKAAKQHILKMQGQGKTVKIIAVGKKARDLLKNQFDKSIIHRQPAMKGKQPDYVEAENVAKIVISLFEKGEIDSASIVYNKFVNALTQIVTIQSLVPLELPAEPANDNAPSTSAAPYEYEPSEAEILASLLPKNIAVQIYKAVLENYASEQGARMTAMDNATRNAGEMIHGLSLKYNRSRQAAITKELIEIISGAEAL
jgi:F-type H+-transporting ATPase subunit gamma